MPIALNPVLIKATIADYPTIQNMARFYVYDASRYCKWDIPSDGLYECHDFKHHFEQIDNYPFLIKADNELAGFAIIDKKGTTTYIDWNMAQFFVLAKFQAQGIGKKIVYHLFEQFEGTWQIKVIPENIGALKFWESTITSYTKGNFTKKLQNILEPEPHPMLTFEFGSKS